MTSTLTEAVPAVDDRLQFDGKRTSWRVRASTENGRYTIATCSVGKHVLYTIIDWHENIRGAMNVSGGGLGIFTRSGPDPEIDGAIEMLEEGIRFEEQRDAGGPIVSDYWTVSHRNRVPLNVTRHTAAQP